MGSKDSTSSKGESSHKFLIDRPLTPIEILFLGVPDQDLVVFCQSIIRLLFQKSGNPPSFVR